MIKLAVAPRFARHYAALSKTEQSRCDEAVGALPEAFGQPHRHAGLGIRALRRGVYECRAGLNLRIGFTQHGDTLLLQVVGDHGALRRWLRDAI